MKETFVERAAERGVPARTIDAVFKAFEPFERYGFNKAHATCYGLIAYQTAYLKANYTVDYMTSVLSAFRDNAEKVAAAIAECRRLGIDVRTPDVHRSHLGFTVEDDAIRFGLLAVKNVGEGAIESIIKAREEGGEFRSLTDFCTRVDLRLANRKVLESLARVGALNCFGHPAADPAGLDDAIAAGQAAQRDRISGQTSLFDIGGDEAATLERPLPSTPETPVRERLRWEKELTGALPLRPPDGRGRGARRQVRDGLQRRPEGRVAGRPARGPGRHRHGSPVRDDQGTGHDGRRDAGGSAGDPGGGRVPQDLRDDDGDVARRRDPAGGRARGPPGRRGVAARRLGVGLGRGRGARAGGLRARGGVAGQAGPARDRGRGRATAGHGSGGGQNGDGRANGGYPANGGATPATPIPTYSEPPGLVSAARADGTESAEEPPLPEEAGARAVADAQAPSRPIEAAPGAVLNVRFARGAGTDRVVSAMQAFKSVLRERPGATRVVVHVPAPGGDALPMELRGVAYDAELVAEVRRRVGDDVIDLRLA